MNASDSYPRYFWKLVTVEPLATHPYFRAGIIDAIAGELRDRLAKADYNRRHGRKQDADEDGDDDNEEEVKEVRPKKKKKKTVARACT